MKAIKGTVSIRNEEEFYKLINFFVEYFEFQSLSHFISELYFYNDFFDYDEEKFKEDIIKIFVEKVWFFKIDIGDFDRSGSCNICIFEEIFEIKSASQFVDDAESFFKKRYELDGKIDKKNFTQDEYEKYKKYNYLANKLYGTV